MLKLNQKCFKYLKKQMKLQININKLRNIRGKKVCMLNLLYTTILKINKIMNIQVLKIKQIIHKKTYLL